MKKFGVVLLILFLVLCVVAGFGGWYVYSKVKQGDFSFLASLTSLNQSVSTDLGVTFTQEDIQKVHQTLDSRAIAVTMESPECAMMSCEPGKAIYSGTKDLDVTLTNTEITALVNEWIQLSPNAPFTSAQARVNPDGSISFAGIADIKQFQRFAVASKIPSETMGLITKYVGQLGETFPVNATMTAGINDNKVNVKFSSVRLGIIAVPSSVLTQYKDEIDVFIDERLDVVEGLDIKKLSFENEKTIFKGTVPKTVYYVK